MCSREEQVPAVRVFRGTIVHSTADVAVQIHEDSVLVAEQGRVTQLRPAHELPDILQRTGAFSEDVVRLGRHQLLMPGLVDTHIHPAQYPNAGLALDMPLLDWVKKYTYPLEAQFYQEAFAHRVYSTVVERTLRLGTTCASYFATMHRPACEALVDICRDRGQRALVGKVNKDRSFPAFYREMTEESIYETTGESLQETKAFVNNVLSGADGKNGIVQPTITPGYAITCTGRLMRSLAELAKDRDLFIQTHCNESLPAMAIVRELFPDSATEVETLRKVGLLGPRTVLAHCIHMQDDEVEIMRQTGTGVAHCAASNICLMSGLCDAKQMGQVGINIGIGTDISGGYNPSVLDGIRAAIQTSKIHAIQRPGYKPIDYRDGFKMATLGGASALGVADRIGNFEPGKQLDALLVSIGDGDSEVDLLKPMSTDELLQKFIYLGDSRDIMRVYVAGKEVISNPNATD